MIGNDIVDLALASSESNWRRKGYLTKILTDSELHLLQNSNNQEVAIWSLWSRKEAVYKILLQAGEKRGYYPKKIECLDLNNTHGIVKFENQFYFTNSYLEEDFVYSEAVTAISHFKKIVTFTDEINLFKVNGIPFVEQKGKILNVSKTNHGRFEKTVYLSF